MGLSSIVYHAFTPIMLAGMIIVGVTCLKLTSKFSVTKLNESLSNLKFALVILIGAISWWLYVSFAVFWQLTTILNGVLVGEMRPFVPIPVVPLLPGLMGQLNLTNFLGNFTLLVILIPAIIVIVLNFYPALKKRISSKETRILFLASIIITFGFVYLFLKLVSQEALGHRFFFLSQIFLVVLSTVSVFELLRRNKLKKTLYKKMIYIPFAFLFISLVVISPIPISLIMHQ
jgi:hypothetical protein